MSGLLDETGERNVVGRGLERKLMRVRRHGRGLKRKARAAAVYKVDAV